MRLVLVESPWASDPATNLRYLRACMLDSLHRGEAPLASVLLYAHSGVLDDLIREERALGIEAGLAWGAKAELSAVYTDRGISSGMAIGIRNAQFEGRPVEYRRLGGEWATPSAATEAA